LPAEAATASQPATAEAMPFVYIYLAHCTCRDLVAFPVFFFLLNTIFALKKAEFASAQLDSLGASALKKLNFYYLSLQEAVSHVINV
jgi:hypothetical protein